jgi:hypothetical protein
MRDMGFFDKLWKRRDAGDLATQIERALNGLAAAMSAHDATWHIGEAAWDVDQDRGTIVFTNRRGMRAEAPVQFIGTYSAGDGTWLWAWDNPSLSANVTEHARRMREYGAKHALPELTTRTLRCSEQECWGLTALAYMVCGANGAYSGASGSGRLFMTFGELRLSKAA